MAIKYGKIHDINGESNDVIYPETNDSAVKLTSDNEILPEGINTMRDLIDALGALAFEDSVEINAASISVPGLVQLSNVTTNTSNETEAATVKAVSMVNANAVHITGNQDVAGIKDFTEGIIHMNGAEFNYDPETNILVIGVPNTAQSSGGEP